MKIVGREVSRSLSSIRREVESLCGPIKFDVLTGEDAYGRYRLEEGKPHIWVITDLRLTDPQFEHIVAHEMMHAVQVEQDWPTAEAAQECGEGSGEAVDCLVYARVARDLHNLVLDLDVEDRLKKLERSCAIVLDPTYGMEGRYQHLTRRLQSGVSFSPGSFGLEYERLALVYALETLLGSPWMGLLEELYLKHAPQVAAKGKELVLILHEKGWATPDQALVSMIAIRDSLDLAKTCIIVDRKSQRRF